MKIIAFVALLAVILVFTGMEGAAHAAVKDPIMDFLIGAGLVVLACICLVLLILEMESKDKLRKVRDVLRVPLLLSLVVYVGYMGGISYEVLISQPVSFTTGETPNTSASWGFKVLIADIFLIITFLYVTLFFIDGYHQGKGAKI